MMEYYSGIKSNEVLKNAKVWMSLKTGREGNRQEDQGSPNRGNRLQVSDIFYFSLKQQEETK